jgi:uncharacterized protein (TIGR02231 family)
MTETTESRVAVHTVDAPITGVTVFMDGARILRTAVTPVAAGQATVVIGRLPASADTTSVRVAARGHDLSLLNVDAHRRFGTDPLREQTGQLQADVERCHEAVRELDDEDAAEQAGLAFLEHLSDAAATSLARSVGMKRAGYDELAQMAGHLTASTANALGRRREIAARKRVAQRELDAATARLAAAERGSGRQAESVEVAVVLEARADTEAEIELSYHVPGASWRPLYDLVLDGERLAVSYLAEITQKTGEDWPEIALVLSTTRQGLRQTLPELSPWYIGRPRPPRAPMAAGHLVGGTAYGAEAADDAQQPRAFAASAPVPALAQKAKKARVLAAEATESESGAGLVYTVARPMPVPGDGGPHKTLVAAFDADAVLGYLTVPVLAPEAYLRATVTNGSLLLLPGQARIFHGAQFVGETRLDTVAPGEEFEVKLGVDDQVKVERKLRRRTASKAILGGTRTIDIAYEITVENHRDRKARVSVHDHLPVSTDGDIKVRLRETTPPPAETDDLGELTWNLTLDPAETAAIRHRFTVEHPAQVAIAGL